MILNDDIGIETVVVVAAETDRGLCDWWRWGWPNVVLFQGNNAGDVNLLVLLMLVLLPIVFLKLLLLLLLKPLIVGVGWTNADAIAGVWDGKDAKVDDSDNIVGLSLEYLYGFLNKFNKFNFLS